jgi:hypothetical protein
LKGIQYLVDEHGNRTAVVIDLAKHGELWEDVYDAFVIEHRRDEPAEPFEEVVARLEAQGKL